MFEPKPLSAESIPDALEKAEQYRLLNEPRLAESICLDVLAVDPDNQEALRCIVLATADLLKRRRDAGVKQAREYIARLKDEYRRAYYNGIVCERRGLVVLREAAHYYQHVAHGWFTTAMEYYAEAEKLRPPGNDAVILRWNTVVRIFQTYPNLEPFPDDDHEPQMIE